MGCQDPVGHHTETRDLLCSPPRWAPRPHGIWAWLSAVKVCWLGRQVSPPSGANLKVALSEVWGMDWLTFEGLFLSEDSLSLDLDFCSATRHGSL